MYELMEQVYILKVLNLYSLYDLAHKVCKADYISKWAVEDYIKSRVCL